MLSEFLQASERSVPTVLGVVLVSTALGLLLASLASRSGTFWDGLVSRFLELSGALHFMLVIPLLQNRWSALASTIAALGGYQALRLARLGRNEMRFVRRRRFVLAARAMGLSATRTEWVHVLPHAAPAIVVNLAFSVPLVVSVEAALAFLNLDQSASWGRLIVSSTSGNFAALLAVVGMTLLSHHAAERAVRRLLPHAIEAADDAPLATPRDRSR